MIISGASSSLSLYFCCDLSTSEPRYQHGNIETLFNTTPSETKSEQELLKEWKTRQAKEEREKERKTGRYKVSRIPRILVPSKTGALSVGRQIVAANAKYLPPTPQ